MNDFNAFLLEKILKKKYARWHQDLSKFLVFQTFFSKEKKSVKILEDLNICSTGEENNSRDYTLYYLWNIPQRFSKKEIINLKGLINKARFYLIKISQK